MRSTRFWCTCLALALSCWGTSWGWCDSPETADDGTDGEIHRQQDGWTTYFRDGQVRLIATERTIYPAKWNAGDATQSFLPPDHEMTDGNAALWYLQAVGFLEQQASADWLYRFHAQEVERMSRESDYDPAPYRWRHLPPDELDVGEVKEYLQYFQFQNRLLERAHHCRKFDLQRDARRISRPADYLLPEMQAFRRTIARIQSLRARLALSEDRIHDAQDWIGREFHLAHHLSLDTFLPSTSVGADVAREAFEDAVHLICHQGCPNLYDAIGSLPDPLIDQTSAIDFHKQLLLYQIPQLRVFQQPGIAAIDPSTFVQQVVPLFEDCDLREAFDHGGRAAVALYVSKVSEETDRYLMQFAGFTETELQKATLHERYFKAIVQLYDQVQRQQLRRLSQSSHNEPSAPQRQLDSRREFPQLHNAIAWLMLDVDRSVAMARHRVGQRLALLQTIEAIRDHMARHGKLPESLGELQLPAPIDPVTGNAINYRVADGNATLTAASNGFEQVRIVLTAAGLDVASPATEIVSAPAELSLPLIRYQLPTAQAFSRLTESDWWKQVTKRDRDRITALMLSQGGDRVPSDDPTAEVTGTLLWTPSGLLQPILSAANQDSPELVEPLKWMGQDSIGAFLVIPDLARSALKDSLVEESSEASVVAATLTRWAGIRFDLNRPALEIVIQCISDDAAKRVQSDLDTVVKVMFDRLVGVETGDLIDQSLAQLSTHLDGDRLQLRWSGSDQGNAAIALAVSGLSDLIRQRNEAVLQTRMGGILLALHNYHSAYAAMPPFARRPRTTVSKGLSWRVHLLPFIRQDGCQALWERFKLDEPWDSPHNKLLIDQMPEIYASIPHTPKTTELAAGMTTLLAPQGTDCALGVDGAERFRSLIDGLSNTIFVVESDPSRAVPWTAPDDFQYDPARPTDGLAIEDDRVTVAFGDGRVRRLPLAQPEGSWNALFTGSSKEDLRPFWNALKAAESNPDQ
ncbi:DUF1559 family PulG-like putative transporter [Stieleria tagensis]|uniref:DUF1559 family PulG-like putative transporter n=1 Tax=Stieleria tagensis TaxID=2956795 RepID=UPI00209AE959|nr:DUF1559 domain-containing protein [Stieleria tagensis]